MVVEDRKSSHRLGDYWWSWLGCTPRMRESVGDRSDVLGDGWICEESASGFVQTQNGLVNGLCVWHWILFYTDWSLLNIYLYGGGEFILCLTPFFETYELKGYIVEVISDISHFGNVTCWVMLKWSLCWLFVIGSFIWSSILVIISMIICWPKAWLCTKAWLCGRDFVKPHNPVMVETGIVAARFQGSLP